jgi:hypothetical protein
MEGSNTTRPAERESATFLRGHTEEEHSALRRAVRVPRFMPTRLRAKSAEKDPSSSNFVFDNI